MYVIQIVQDKTQGETVWRWIVIEGGRVVGEGQYTSYHGAADQAYSCIVKGYS